MQQVRTSVDAHSIRSVENNSLSILYPTAERHKVGDGEDYPNPANTDDSLGRAYLSNGDKELSVKNYHRSLESNPDNTNALEMLRTLREQ